jgi:hypothetical protein
MAARWGLSYRTVMIHPLRDSIESTALFGFNRDMAPTRKARALFSFVSG